MDAAPPARGVPVSAFRPEYPGAGQVWISPFKIRGCCDVRQRLRADFNDDAFRPLDLLFRARIVGLRWSAVRIAWSRVKVGTLRDEYLPLLADVDLRLCRRALTSLRRIAAKNPGQLQNIFS